MRLAALLSLALVALGGCSGPAPGIHLQLTGQGIADLNNFTVSLDQVRIQHVDGDRDPALATLADLQDVDLASANQTAWGRAVFATTSGDLWIVVHAAGKDPRGAAVEWTQPVRVGAVNVTADAALTIDVGLGVAKHGSSFEATYSLVATRLA